MPGRIGVREGISLRAGRLPLEPKDGEQQFAEVESAEALEHVILTVCSAAPEGSDHGQLEISRVSDGWHVSGQHGNQTVKLVITCKTGDLLEIAL